MSPEEIEKFINENFMDVSNIWLEIQDQLKELTN